MNTPQARNQLDSPDKPVTYPVPHADNGDGLPGFAILLVLFITFRLFTGLLYRPGGYIRDYSDFIFYLGGASQIDHGALPFRDYWSEYPPPFPWITVALYKLVRPLPLWEDPRLWFNTALILFLLIWETINLVALYAIARLAWGRSSALRSAWLYAMLFAPVYTLTSAYDAFPLAFMLLGLWGAMAMRPTWAGLAIGIGTSIKLFPIIMIGPAARLFRRPRHWVQLLLPALLVVLVVAGIAYALSPAYFTAFARGLIDRSSWSTVWALLDGFDHIGAIVGDRADPAADVSLHESHLPWPWITLAFGLVYLWVWTRRWDDRSPEHVITLAGFTVSLLFLYFKAWNPQYLVYILPFIALLLPNLRGVTYAVLLTGLNAIEHPILAGVLTETPWLLGAVIIARTIVLGLIAAETGLMATRPQPALPRWWPRLAYGLMATVTLGLLLLTPPTWSAYRSSRLLKDRMGPTAIFLRAQTEPITLVLTSPMGFRHIYPLLHDRANLVLAAGPQREARLTALTRAEQPLWLWVENGEDPDTLQQLAEGQPFIQLAMPGGTLYRIGDKTWTPTGPGTLGGGYRLIGAHIDPPIAMPGQKITLMLYWMRVGRAEGNYTVFTHLLTPEGTLAAGRDNPPVNGTMPTDTWPERTLIVDRYRLRVPWNARSGLYPIEIGMYDPVTGQRLPATDANGHPSGDRILLPQRLRVLPRLWRAWRVAKR
ncbi:MAG: DUF2029 domain-containing protein [Anaerolineae bacterium]|nr:DUF2029 domain-containing protein [Anaerolineae bacterium]